jgi:hypothetical protein
MVSHIELNCAFPIVTPVAVAAEKEARASYGMGTGSMDYCIVAPLHH